jgi:class 3 adenylate cyclase
MRPQPAGVVGLFCRYGHVRDPPPKAVTGEIEIGEKDVQGIAVHIAARIAAIAAASEILVSRTVKDRVAGSGLRFNDRGRHSLKGLQEAMELYAAQS